MDPAGVNSLYFGGGAAFELAWFEAIRPLANRSGTTRDTLIGGGLNLDLLVGYEFLEQAPEVGPEPPVGVGQGPGIDEYGRHETNPRARRRARRASTGWIYTLPNAAPWPMRGWWPRPERDPWSSAITFPFCVDGWS